MFPLAFTIKEKLQRNSKHPECIGSPEPYTLAATVPVFQAPTSTFSWDANRFAGRANFHFFLLEMSLLVMATGTPSHSLINFSKSVLLIILSKMSQLNFNSIIGHVSSQV